MEESENIEKPLLYRLTDRWVPRIIFAEFLLLILYGFILGDYKENLSNQITIIILGVFGYFGMKWLLTSAFKRFSSMKIGAVNLLIGFYWIFGIFLGFLGPFLELITSNTDLNLMIFLSSIVGFSFALGASNSWEYSFQVKSEEESEN